jgi:tetratricopeptide (TPR) repeat protein
VINEHLRAALAFERHRDLLAEAEAARDAARAGARREAVAHFGLALEHAGRFLPDERAELLQEYAIECYTIGAADRAARAQRRAVALNRSRGDPRALGDSLRWLARMRWWAGERAGAERANQEAIGVLEQAGDARLLALAVPRHAGLRIAGADLRRRGGRPGGPVRAGVRGVHAADRVGTVRA